MYEDLVIMKDINKGRCPFCESQNLEYREKKFEAWSTICPICGRYVINTFNLPHLENIKDEVAYVLYHSEHENTRILGNESFYEKVKDLYPQPSFVSIDSVGSFHPSKFSEKVEYTLLDIARRSMFFGDSVVYDYNSFCSAFFVKKFGKNGEKLESSKTSFQIQKIISYFKSKSTDYADIVMSDDGFPVQVELNPTGWQRIENIEIADKNNRNVFIAMAFGDETKQTREALRRGITNAGYIPILIDEVMHNHQIIPEMFKQIRKSKFLVIDISVPNTGAYYEAGYAQGLGKEVIFCCSQKSFNNQEKNMRPHFDVSQKQMILWNDENDLSIKLEQWILSLFQ